jgi:nucleotide-binding universal stress UspA family protein
LALAHRAAVAAVSPGRQSPIFSDVLVGAVVPTLADYAAHADMLVVGCDRRSGFSRALFGSVSAGLDHHAQCPLGVVHGDDSVMTRSSKAPVVVGIDGSSASDSAIEIAFDEASRRAVDLVALHTWNDEGPANFGRPAHAPIEWAEFQAQEEEVLAERLAGWASRYPDVSVHKVVVADRPAHRLLQLAEKAQLLVLGSHPRGGIAGALRRSVSSVVVAAAHTPVIVAHTGH